MEYFEKNYKVEMKEKNELVQEMKKLWKDFEISGDEQFNKVKKQMKKIE